jgi:integrase
MRVEITDRTLKALRPGTKVWRELFDDGDGGRRQRPILWDELVTGFGVRVTDKGKRTFVLVKRYPGAKQPAPRELGEVRALTLGKARDKARTWLELLQKNIDPKAAEEAEGKRRAEDEEKKRREQADTFAATFEMFVSRHLSTLRTGGDVEREMRRMMLPPDTLLKHEQEGRLVLPQWGSKPLASITRKDVIGAVYALHDGGAPVMANRLLSYLKKFFAWCLERDLIEASPAALVKKPGKETKRDHVLADHEIRELWLACDRLGAFGRAVQFMLATGQRRSEVGGARWAEIDRDARVWRLPAGRTKAGRSHELPLNDLALRIIDQSPELGPFLFATREDKPINGWSKGKKRLEAAAFGGWHLHDARRACATGLARLGVDRVVIAAILNHADPSVTAIYDRHTREPEMRAAMDAWSRRLEQIIGGRKAGRQAGVVPFPVRA